MSLSPTHVIEAKNLSVSIGRGGGRIVDGLDFAIEPGGVLALVGESGSGKTMAARAILNLLPQPLEIVSESSIRLRGTELVGASPGQLRSVRGARIGMVFQEPMVSLNPSMPIGRQMAEGLRLHRSLSDAEIRDRSLAMLERIQIKDPVRCLAAYPHEFSGGMRQRIMIASVMLLKPKLLIADEPTTALDTLTQREVLDLMVGLTRDEGTAVLLITHNLGLVGRYADRAVVLRHGRVVEQGPSRALLAAPADPYTRELVDAVPRRGVFPPRAVRTPAPPLLEARAVSVTYPGRMRLFGAASGKRAVEGASLAIHPGEFVAVVGGSGSGKTTLGRALMRLLPSSAGEVRFRGADVTRAQGKALHDFRLSCQMVFQDPYSSLDPRMTVGEIVAEPLRLVPGLDRAQARERLEEALAQVGLAGYTARHPHMLSGGQRQRVAIARAIIRRPAFVMADEPVSALDMTIQKQVLTLFRDLQARHAFACLFISHDLAAVEQVADRVVVMQEGRIIEEGPTEEIFLRPRHAYTRALLEAAPMLESA